MRDNHPDEWNDACEFDDTQRSVDIGFEGQRKKPIGQSYVHRQLVPLREADLHGDGETQGGGCGSLFDGQDGLCGV